jgi:hypothetical protein
VFVIGSSFWTSCASSRVLARERLFRVGGSDKPRREGSKRTGTRDPRSKQASRPHEQTTLQPIIGQRSPHCAHVLRSSVPPLASPRPLVSQPATRTATAQLLSPTHAHTHSNTQSPRSVETNTQTLRIPSPISRKLHLFAENQITMVRKAPPRQRTVWGKAAPRNGTPGTHRMAR